LGALFDALSTAPHAFDALKLGFPVQVFESMEEVRQAIRVAPSLGQFARRESAQASTSNSLSLTVLP
jgi:hypothetical protein